MTGCLARTGYARRGVQHRLGGACPGTERFVLSGIQWVSRETNRSGWLFIIRPSDVEPRLVPTIQNLTFRSLFEFYPKDRETADPRQSGRYADRVPVAG